MKNFYIGYKDDLLKIQETKEGYHLSTPLEHVTLNQLAVDPGEPRRLYLATDEGLWMSEDGGDHFKKLDNELKNTKLTAVAANPIRKVEGRHTVYAGAEPSRVFYSNDHGKSWSEYKGIQDLPSKNSWSFPPRPETHYVRWVTLSETDGDYVAVTIEAGAVIYTTDHGKTWRDRAEVGPIDVHTLLKHPDAPARLYAANGGLVSNKAQRESYAESPDGGYSWEFMSEGLEEHPYLYHLALHPNHADYRLASASKNAKEAHGKDAYSTVYQKAGDEPWTEFAAGLPKEGAFSHHLTHDPTDVDAFYALNNFGIYYLGRDADHWAPLDIPWADELKEKRPYFFVVQDQKQ